MATFLIANCQFGRASVIKSNGRPFGNVIDMNEEMIENWNKSVGPEDTVIHLGNFAWDPTTALEVLEKLNGKNIALIFEKASTRTRCAFEVAAFDQGAQVSYLGPSGSQIGQKESMKDTARVLGRMYDGIEYRGFGQSIVEDLGAYAGVPVWNGLTDEFHPTQILADFLTMIEHGKFSVAQGLLQELYSI